VLLEHTLPSKGRTAFVAPHPTLPSLDRFAPQPLCGNERKVPLEAAEPATFEHIEVDAYGVVHHIGVVIASEHVAAPPISAVS